MQVSGGKDQSRRGTQYSLPRVRLLQTSTTGESHDSHMMFIFMLVQISSKGRYNIKGLVPIIIYSAKLNWTPLIYVGGILHVHVCGKSSSPSYCETSKAETVVNSMVASTQFLGKISN